MGSNRSSGSVIGRMGNRTGATGRPRAGLAVVLTFLPAIRRKNRAVRITAAIKTSVRGLFPNELLPPLVPLFF